MVHPFIRRVATFVVAAASCSALLSAVAMGQKQEHGARKIVTRVEPAYPDLAKRMHVAGVVKVEAVVGANGVVKSTRVLGGNPVLIESATDAVRKWKFEAASAQSTEVLQLTFQAQ